VIIEETGDGSEDVEDDVGGGILSSNSWFLSPVS
jgi:hypothetical protein